MRLHKLTPCLVTHCDIVMGDPDKYTQKQRRKMEAFKLSLIGEHGTLCVMRDFNAHFSPLIRTIQKTDEAILPHTFLAILKFERGLFAEMMEAAPLYCVCRTPNHGAKQMVQSTCVCKRWYHAWSMWPDKYKPEEPMPQRVAKDCKFDCHECTARRVVEAMGAAPGLPISPGVL